MARLRSIRRKIATLARAGPHRQLLVAEAIACMLVARVMVLVTPSAALSKSFGSFVAPDDPRVAAQTGTTAARALRIRRIGWAIRAAAPYMPFRSVCLQQAMAGHAMLKRRGFATVMHFGAGRASDRPIDTHAWLDAEGVRVTGYPVASNLIEIACFVRSPAAAAG